MTPEELQQIAETRRNEQNQAEHRINVCTAASCMSRHSDKLADKMTEQVKAKGEAGEKTHVRCVGCMGLCSAGPLVEVDHPKEAAETGKSRRTMYREVEVSHAEALVNAAVDDRELPDMVQDTNIPYFARQKRIVTENSGYIDPDSIEDYIAAGGYSGLVKALTELTPDIVIHEVTNSGLRGRGGAGFPTGLKWSTVARTDADQKYVICNADEGDPGAFMDRAVLESDPHRVIEGMAIAGYAVGASKAYIYVRAEYPLAIKRLKRAIREANRAELLGTNLCDTPFTFDIELRLGAGAFVCGEETALISSVEGRRGVPRPRPPFPASYGLYGKPTLINNVETFANIPWIVREGGAAMAAIGTEHSRGTKVFALAGKIKNNGLIEVPMGISLREIVYDIGDGVPDGKAFKAVQTGGPSGGCVPAKHLDMPVDYESLMKAGTIMGSGGMVVMDESSNMVDVARFFMEFCKDESCGKCIPCRVGTSQMLDLLEKFSHRKAAQRDMDLLKELCDVVKACSLCGLGQTAPNPVLSTLRYFESEYLDSITEGTLQ
jgi:bidirectional [NiFe] hydrogenase diaphorase subunit